ncbi:MAG: hypothetical protein Q8O13_04585 [Candidatus Omnitrophota bacterium]|nr:hypothetical protein [Candidatus Omnitrophota bacterium]
MRPIKHLVASCATGALFYLYSKSVLASLVCFLSGVFIDLDHVFDFYFHYKRLTLSIKEFYLSCEEYRFDRLFLFFHSLEWILLLWILIAIFKLNLIWVAFALGISLHIVMDMIGNRLFSYAYFFIYRWLKGFRAESLSRDAL